MRISRFARKSTIEWYLPRSFTASLPLKNDGKGRQAFPFGKTHFQGRAVKLEGCMAKVESCGVSWAFSSCNSHDTDAHVARRERVVFGQKNLTSIWTWWMQSLIGWRVKAVLTLRRRKQKTDGGGFCKGFNMAISISVCFGRHTSFGHPNPSDSESAAKEELLLGPVFFQDFECLRMTEIITFLSPNLFVGNLPKCSKNLGVFNPAGFCGWLQFWWYIHSRSCMFFGDRTWWKWTADPWKAQKDEAHKDLPEISQSISESMHINLGGGFNHLFMFIPI